MIILVASAIVVLSVPISGRSLAPLAQLHVRRIWLVWGSVVVQLAITLPPTVPSGLGDLLHVLSFVTAGAFIWSNRATPGVVLIAAGGAMNLAAIAANGGTMPASAWAWRTAGFATEVNGFENSGVVHHARLAWLGDVFCVPASWPFSNVFSVGDVVVVAGLAVLVHRICRRQPGVAGPDAVENDAAAVARMVVAP